MTDTTALRATILHKLETAIENDHPCDDLQGCDIALALSEGHVAWAAHLLTGATECEETEALYVEFTATFASDDELQAYLRAECDELCKHPHWTCEKCNSVQWADPDDESECTNCLHVHQGKPEPEDTTCESGIATLTNCEAEGSTFVDWMPEHLRASHDAAGNSGTWPLNGVLRLHVCADCAACLIEDDCATPVAEESK
jgi:hypothetical protein